MYNKKAKYYYQIDYIDVYGFASYIDTFTSRQRKKAIEHVNILNSANRCISGNTYYVLDKYISFDDDDDKEIVEADITNAELFTKYKKEN